MMAHRVNPIIFRLNKTSDWKSKYFQKKSTESAVFDFKNLEIRNFISRFFESNGMLVPTLNLSYSSSTLNIFVAYFSTLKSTSFAKTNNRIQNIRCKKRRRRIKLKFSSKYQKIKQSNEKYLKYEEIRYFKILNKITKQKTCPKLVYQREKVTKRLRRLKLLKYCKTHLLLKRNPRFDKIIKKSSFLTRFLKSLSLFTGHKTDISLTLHKLNNNMRRKIPEKKWKIVKRNLTELRKDERKDFFKESVNILFSCVRIRDCAALLSNFIATQLKKLRRHNSFIKFLNSTLKLFLTNTFSKLNGIKIKIKGRFNRAPRARYKIVRVGKSVPILTLDSKIDYSETISYAVNGTFGVKVWVF